MKKKILVIILAIVIIIIGVIGYFIVLDMKQEQKLITELTQISELTNAENINIDEIYQRLDKVVTKGDYAIVEEAFKNYLKDNFDNMIRISEILEDEKILNILSVENYKNDGKEFIETKNYIANTREELENCKTKYSEFFTQEKAMSYINNKELDSYYIDLYKQEIVGDIENENSDDIIEKSINQIIDILNISEEIINFLSNNKDNWQVEGESIVFNSERLSNEYNELLKKMTEENETDSIAYNKIFGSYEVPKNWIESKEHSTDSKFFYVLDGEEQKSQPNNISINAGKNQYSKTEHENFRKAILNQLSSQIAEEEGVQLTANGSNTANGYVLYTFNIKEADSNIETIQYYIVGDYKYILVQETVFEESEEIDNVAKEIVNSFKWAE